MLKLEGGNEALKIMDRTEKSDKKCEVCLNGKSAQSRNRELDEKEKGVLEPVQADLVGTVTPAAKMVSDISSGDRSIYTIQGPSLLIS